MGAFRISCYNENNFLSLAPTILGLGVPWHVEEFGLSLLSFDPDNVMFSNFGILSQPPVSPFSQSFGFLRRAVCIRGPKTSVLCSQEHSVLCFFLLGNSRKRRNIVVVQLHCLRTSFRGHKMVCVFVLCARPTRCL